MNWTKLIFYLFLACFIAAAVFFFSRVMSYVLISLVFAYLLDPPVNWLEKFRIPRWLAIISVYGAILGVLAWLSARFIPTLVIQGQDLLETLHQSEAGSESSLIGLPIVSDLHQLLKNLDYQLPNFDLSGRFIVVLDNLQTFLVGLPNTILQNFSTIISAVSYISMVPLISFFLLKDKTLFRKAIIAVIPNRYFEISLILINKIDETVGRYMRAMLFEVIAVAFMVGITLSIMGVPYAILIGVVAGVANIIPYFGPLLGAGVAVLSVVLNGLPPSMILWAVAAMYLVQVIDNNIVYPIVVGKTINMHPLIVLLTVLAGAWFGGILWMLLSVPLVYISYSVVRVLYTNLRDFRLL